MGVLEFKQIFSRSFLGSNRISQVVLIFLLIPCGLTMDFRAPPLLPDIPFIWGWNAPTEGCLKKFNVSLDLSLFSLIGSPKKTATGQSITIFYVGRLGLYPHVDKQGTDRNGGIPQLGNLQGHLIKAKKDIAHYMPKDKVGLAIIDWEEWRPIWSRNWKPKDIYWNRSIALVKRRNSQLSDTEATNIAREEFELAGKNFMLKTLKLGKSLRPKYLWGYYLFPDCYNRNPKPNYNGSCTTDAKRRNDELNWLWTESTALFPSIYLNTKVKSPRAALFVRNRVQEGLRVSKVASNKHPLPVFGYICPVFTNIPSEYISEEDLVHTVGESVSLGVSGIILWGSLNFTESVDTCRTLQNYLKTALNPYLINVTLAAKICSQVFCQEKGFCIRRNWNSNTYLHLNPMNVAVESSKDGTFKIKGKPSNRDLEYFDKHFDCACFPQVDCKKKVNIRGKQVINVCATKGICVNSTLNSVDEIFHSNTSLVLFSLFLIFFENEYYGIKTGL